MHIRYDLTPQALDDKIARMWAVSGPKIEAIERDWRPEDGAPVFTVGGRYTAQGWTEWTQGFQFGSAILQFDATGDDRFLTLGRQRTRDVMAPHLTHTGVHDHGFNTVSTYGNLLRLAVDGRFKAHEWEVEYYRLAIRCSGAVQAARWTPAADGLGFIPSFNGPHSLFIDTIRTLRILAMAYRLGHVLMGEGDERISLLARLAQHAVTTARYNVFFGEGRDIYDVAGRVAHETVFNTRTGAFRCPATQQGYSGFSTWTRGLAWALCGFAELAEFLDTVEDGELVAVPFGDSLRDIVDRTARATAEFYISNTATDGIPYWDTGAPGLTALGDWRAAPSNPLNPHEPVDSSAAAISAQGLLRLGLRDRQRDAQAGSRLIAAGLTVVDALLGDVYLSADPDHHGLVLHSQYHRPNGWDHVPPGRSTPCGEATMWGDYHTREVALLVQRLARGEPHPTFFSGVIAQR